MRLRHSVHADETIDVLEPVVDDEVMRRVDNVGCNPVGLESLAFLKRQLTAAAFAIVAWGQRIRLAFVAAHDTSKNA